jgi:hypothetical protein
LSVWRNKIAALSALACALVLTGGCVSRRTVVLDAKNPAVRVSMNGVLFGDTFVKPQEVPEILDDHGVPRDRVIHILLDSEVRDLREARFLMACLGRGGYTRPVLVTKRHAESINRGKRKNVQKSEAGPHSGRKIRYRRGNEK